MANETILVVDADTKSQKVLEVSFKKAGYRVIITDAMREAIQRVATERPDLIITDVALPDGDGFTFCEQLKSNPKFKDIPLVFLAEESGLAQKMKGFELGAEEYLTKPIYIKEVTSKVELILQKRAKEALESGDAEEVAGDLSEITMIDLLQTIERELRSGTIELERESHHGTVYFREGNILDAACGKLQGEEAIFRLMLWPKGTFVIRYHDQMRRADHVEKDASELLMEGMRRFDRWNEMVLTLPHLSRIFDADLGRLPQILKQLPPEVERVVRLFDGYRSLRDVIDESPLDDLTTLRIIRKLLDDELLTDTTPAEADLRQTAQQTNLASWLAGKPMRQTEDAPASAPPGAQAPAVFDSTLEEGRVPDVAPPGPQAVEGRGYEEGRAPKTATGINTMVGQWRFHWDQEAGEAVATPRAEQPSRDAFALDDLARDLEEIERRRREEEARRIKAEQDAALGLDATSEPEAADEATTRQMGLQQREEVHADPALSPVNVQAPVSLDTSTPEAIEDPAPAEGDEAQAEGGDDDDKREITKELHRNTVLKEVEEMREREEAREREATPHGVLTRPPEADEAPSDPFSGIEDMFPERGDTPAGGAPAVEPAAGGTSAERRAVAVEEAERINREAAEASRPAASTMPPAELGERPQAHRPGTDDEERQRRTTENQFPTVSRTPEDTPAADPPDDFGMDLKAPAPLIPLGADESSQPEVSEEDVEELRASQSTEFPVAAEPDLNGEPSEVEADPVTAELHEEFFAEHADELSPDSEEEDDEHDNADIPIVQRTARDKEFVTTEYDLGEDEDDDEYEDDGAYDEYDDDEEYEDDDELTGTLEVPDDLEDDEDEYEDEYDDDLEDDEDEYEDDLEEEEELDDDEEPEEEEEEPEPATIAAEAPLFEDEGSGFSTGGIFAVVAVIIALAITFFVILPDNNKSKDDPGKDTVAAKTTPDDDKDKTKDDPVEDVVEDTPAADMAAAAVTPEPDMAAPESTGLDEPGAEEEAAALGKQAQLNGAIAAITFSGVDPATIEDPLAYEPPVPETPPEPAPPTFEQQLKRAENLLDREKTESARKLMRKLSAERPEDAKTVGLLGRSELYSDNAKAIREMTRATTMGYRSPRLYLDLATAYQIQRNNDKARKTYQEFLRRYPSHKMAAEVRSIVNNTL